MTKQEVVHTFLKALTESDHETLTSLYADDATLEDPVGGDINLSGIDEIREFYKGSVTWGPKAKLLGAIRVAGEEAVFPFEVKLTTPPEGPQMRFEVIDCFRFNAKGKIVAMKAYFGPENITMLD